MIRLRMVSAPQNQTLRYRGMDRQGQGYIYQTAESQCRGGPVKKRCTGGSVRRIFVHWHEPARQKARDLVHTQEYVCSRRARNKIEVLFSELKLGVGVRRVRLSCVASGMSPSSFYSGGHGAKSEATSSVPRTAGANACSICYLKDRQQTKQE
jgi:Transposase DDE domain